MRIVSLLPSATEIVFALGAGDDVVGVTFECDHPEQAKECPVVSSSTVPSGLDAADIDAKVTELTEAGENLYLLDEGALAALDPDLVITQDLCAVCAADVTQVNQALEHLGCTAEVLTVDPRTISEVLDSIIAIGEATGVLPAAHALVDSLIARLEHVRRAVGDRRRVRTLLLEWPDPPFAPGHWLPDMVDIAGGECVLGQSGDESFRIEPQVIANSEAEVVISAPCGFDLAESAQCANDLINSGVVPAQVPVWAVDANAAFTRPGPRVVDGVEALVSILHPDLFGPPDPTLALRSGGDPSSTTE